MFRASPYPLPFPEHHQPIQSEMQDPAYEIIGGSMATGIIILSDHAMNAIPADLDQLGLGAAALARHAAFDIGADGMTRACAAALGCPAVVARFSRLIVDPNRGEDDPTLMPVLTDIGIVPGNVGLSAAAVGERLDRFYRPYHAAIDRLIARYLEAGVVPVLYSLHSFTPVMKGVPRRCHVGVLWDCDDRFTAPLIRAFSDDATLVVSGNQPYDGALAGSTLDRHATLRGLPSAMIEIRQDLVADDASAEAWGVRLADVARPILGNPLLHTFARQDSRCRRPRPIGRQCEPANTPLLATDRAPLTPAA